MRYLFVLVAMALGACSGGDEAGQEVEESPEEVYETFSEDLQRPLEEAEEVERLLEDAAADRDRAIEEAGR
jgi:hypothetical protein